MKTSSSSSTRCQETQLGRRIIRDCWFFLQKPFCSCNLLFQLTCDGMLQTKLLFGSLAGRSQVLRWGHVLPKVRWQNRAAQTQRKGGNWKTCDRTCGVTFVVTCGSIYLIYNIYFKHLPFPRLGLGIGMTPEATLVRSGVLRRPRHQPNPKALHHRRVLHLAELLHHQSILHSKRVYLHQSQRVLQVLHHQDMLQLLKRALHHPELLRPVRAHLHHRKVQDHRKDLQKGLHFPKVDLQKLLQKQLRKRAR